MSNKFHIENEIFVHTEITDRVKKESGEILSPTYRYIVESSNE